VAVPFGDDRVTEARQQLSELDGLLAWVNPIQDGANREQVDELLGEAAAHGIFVSAHPDVIQKMGTKEVLHQTRHLGWGSDASLYRSVDDLAEQLPPGSPDSAVSSSSKAGATGAMACGASSLASRTRR
jgi:hypothetical protein